MVAVHTQHTQVSLSIPMGSVHSTPLAYIQCSCCGDVCVCRYVFQSNFCPSQAAGVFEKKLACASGGWTLRLRQEHTHQEALPSVSRQVLLQRLTSVSVSLSVCLLSHVVNCVSCIHVDTTRKPRSGETNGKGKFYQRCL